MVGTPTNRTALQDQFTSAVGEPHAWRAPSYQFQQNNGRVHFLNGTKEVDGSLTPRAGNKTLGQALTDVFSIIGGFLSPQSGRSALDQANMALERAGWSNASSNDGYKNDFVYAAHRNTNEAAPDIPYTFQPTGVIAPGPSGMGGQ